jgi:iron-sulfur cluster repair protein YtfE (RIC family)
MTTMTATAAPTTLPRTELAPHLAAYAAIHDAMVRDAARLARAVATAPLEEGPALRAWWELFEEAIEHHHTREDDLVFPLVAERDADFTSGELIADHAVLDVHMGLVRGGLEDLATGRHELGEVRTDLVRQVGAFAHHLDDHLAREERIVFPVLATQVSADEYAAMEKEMQKGTPLSSLRFTLPWILDDVHPTLLANAEIPLLLRVLDRWFWERRYARIAAPLHRARGLSAPIR